MQSEKNNSQDLIDRAKRIKLILMDVDGVMTDGKLYYFPDANGKMTEFKGFNSHDGLGLHLCSFLGIVTGIISGRVSPATEERAKILKMRYVYQGKLDKISSWDEILEDAAVTADEVAYLGDDLPDIPLLKRAGLAIAVANAKAEVKTFAHYITPSKGGEGAVREAIELILKSQDIWHEAISRY